MGPMRLKHRLSKPISPLMSGKRVFDHYINHRQFMGQVIRSLFDSVQLGAIRSTNRILMAPLTRTRSSSDHAPDVDLMSQYYSQRASAGLIIRL